MRWVNLYVCGFCILEKKYLYVFCPKNQNKLWHAISTFLPHLHFYVMPNHKKHLLCSHVTLTFVNNVDTMDIKYERKKYYEDHYSMEFV